MQGVLKGHSRNDLLSKLAFLVTLATEEIKGLSPSKGSAQLALLFPFYCIKGNKCMNRLLKISNWITKA